MYYEYFGLTQPPFRITPNTDFFFSGANRGPVLDALMYAITHGEGIVKVSGEVGSGKTMLCNMLQAQLPANVESVYLANPSVGPDEVLHAIAFELQLGVGSDADRLEVMHALQDFLVQRHAEGKRVVLFVEESQSMPVATLEEIRLLSNLETRTDKLLQIVLFGQPELDQILRRPDIRQLRDRIAHSFRLEPLTKDQVREYLMFRMRAAGYRGPEIFSARVVRQIAKASSGLTRRVNLIADKALLAAFAQDTHTVSSAHVRAALRDSEFAHRHRVAWRPLRWAGVAAIAACAGALVLYTQSQLDAQSNTALRGTTHDQMVVADASSSLPAQRTSRSDVQPRSVPVSISSTPRERTLTKLDLPNPAPTSKHASAPADLISARIEATNRWMRTSEPETYSIQLFVAASEQNLRNDLRILPNFIETNDVFMYRGPPEQGGRLNVLWGSYQDRRAALASLQRLPPELQVNRPYVRTIEAIRQEIARSAAH